MSVPYTKSKPKFYHHVGRHYNGEGNTTTYPYTKAGPTQNAFENGVRDASWRRKVALRQNATTSREAIEYKWSVPRKGTIAHRVRNGSCGGNYLLESEGCIPLFPNVVVTWINRHAYPRCPASLVRSSVTRALNRVNEARAPFQGGTFIGELPELTRSLAKAKKGILDGLSKVVEDTVARPRRRYRGYTRRRKQQSKLNAWADNYLGWTFGAQPLIRDVEDLTKALEDGGRWGLQRVTGTAVEKDEVTWVTNDQPIMLTGSKHNCRVYGIDRYVRKVTTKLFVDWGQKPQSKLDHFGLGLRDFVPTIWELIPYSFLVDYFFGVGDWLQAMSAKPLVSFGCTTERETLKCTASAFGVRHAGCTYISHSGDGGNVTLQRDWVKRYIANLNVGIAVKLPPLDSLKWLNMAALGISHARIRTWVNE